MNLNTKLAMHNLLTASRFTETARPPVMFIITVMLAGLLSGWVMTTSPASAQSDVKFSEKEAQTIDRMIMCPVCPAETIDQAQVEISFQMRAVIREMLSEGKSREQILDFFVARYGPDILAAPPKSGVNLLAWILPIAGVAVALVAVYFVIRSMTAQSGLRPVAVRSYTDQSLDPYLEMVDRHLSLNRPVTTTSTPQSSSAQDNDVKDDGRTQGNSERTEADG